MSNVLNEKAKAKLVERLRDGTIYAVEASASEKHVDSLIGQIANGYVCGLCGEKIEGKMWILICESVTRGGAETKTRYFLDNKCYENAKSL